MTIYLIAVTSSAVCWLFFWLLMSALMIFAPWLRLRASWTFLEPVVSETGLPIPGVSKEGVASLRSRRDHAVPRRPHLHAVQLSRLIAVTEVACYLVLSESRSSAPAYIFGTRHLLRNQCSFSSLPTNQKQVKLRLLKRRAELPFGSKRKKRPLRQPSAEWMPALDARSLHALEGAALRATAAIQNMSCSCE